MTLLELQSRLGLLGIVLIPRGDKLHYKAASGSLSAEIKAALAEHKTALMAALAEPGDGMTDAEAVAAIDRAFGRTFGRTVAGPSPLSETIEPDPDELLELIGRCEDAGFELKTWIQVVERRDGKIKEYVRRLSVRDPDGRRRPPDSIVLPLLSHSPIITGYLSRVGSPFFPDPASDEDHRLAMECSIADDRRLRERRSS